MSRDKEPVRVLIAVASKYGATAEIGEHIGQTLSDRGLEVTLVRPKEVRSVEGYDAVIVGSAVYMGRWRKDARRLSRILSAEDHLPRIWLFSSGPVGHPPLPEDDPVDIAAIVRRLSADDHVVFAGRIDPAGLNPGDRAVLRAFEVTGGDFRNWKAITHWAGTIASELLE